MGTTDFLWANCAKKRHGGSPLTGWMKGFFFGNFFIKLAMIRSRPFRFSSAIIVLLILLLVSLSLPLFFHFFFLLIFFGGGTCVTPVFIAALLLDSSLAKKFVMLHFLCIGWVWFGFTWMIHSGNKMVWLAIIF